MGSADGHVAGVTAVVDNGPDGLRWNLVLVGDGYREPELPTYAADVDRWVALLRATDPFAACFPAINVHRVDVVSADSGADDPVDCGGTGAAPRTYFDATFCGAGPAGARFPRLLTVDAGRALATATARVRARHQVVCLVNSTRYGGSGGTVAVASTHPAAAEIALHELGHSAFGLADEYAGGSPAGRPAEPNRPSPDCRMRTLGRPWCPVCTAAVQEVLAPFLPDAPPAP